MAFRVSTDSDTWWHLRAGEEIVVRKALLTEDPFSLTRFQEPWLYPGWLAQVVLFGLYQVFGFAGLNLLTAVMVTLAFLCIWPFVKGHLLLRSSLILLAAATSGVYWSARPQIISFALSGIMIYFLERERSDRDLPLWSYFLLMALWGNIHGGFAIGFILIGAYLGGDFLRFLGRVIEHPEDWRTTYKRFQPTLVRYIAIILISIIGLCLNPHGPMMLSYPFKTVSIGVLREYIQEWQSPDFHMLEVQPFLWMLFLLLISYGVSKKRPHPTDFLLVLGFGFMSFWAARNIALFALASVIPLSNAIASFPDFKLSWTRASKELPEKVQTAINFLLALLLLVAAGVKISIPANNAFNQEKLEEAFPASAVNVLRWMEPGVPLFNSYNWGAYLIWELYPGFLSFVDGRTDLFNDEILEQYLMAWRGESGWQEVFAQWGIELALIEPYSPLAAELRNHGWEILYQDPKSVIFSSPVEH